jgi:hypothetical protein
MYTRREFGLITLSAFASVHSGVRLGVQTYSFRAIPRTPDGDGIDPVIRAMAACGLDECELHAPQLEPAGKSPEDLRAWRMSTPIEHFRSVKGQFDAAGIKIYALNYSPRATYTDAEIDRGFEIARALGAEIITASATQWPIRAYIEYEFPGAGTPVDEVKKCFALAKEALG